MTCIANQRNRDSIRHRIVHLAIVFVMLTSWLRAAEPTRVFIFAGQSNMLGADAKADQIHQFPAYRKVATLREDVLFAYRLGNGDQASNGWVPLRALEAFGPEISFADEVTKHVQFPIAIIKSAVGGTTIAYDWNPEAPQRGQQLYPKTLALIRDALQELTDRGIDYRLEGVMWHQGENDMLDRSLYPQYASSLKQLIRQLRRDLNAPELQWYLGQVSEKGIWGMDHRANLGAFRIQQQQVLDADPLTHFVPTSHLAFEVMDSGQPHYHFGTQGQLQMGQAFAKSYLQASGVWTDTKASVVGNELPMVTKGRMRLFVLAGQRNVEGEDAFVEELANNSQFQGLTKPQKDILFRYSLGGGVTKSTDWEPLGPVDDLGNFGPELSLGAALRSRIPTDEGIAILKFTHSGAQGPDWQPAGNEPEHRRLYHKFLKFVRDAQKDLDDRGFISSIDGVFWHTGENDTYFGPYAQSNAKWNQELLEGLRKDLGINSLPVFITEQHKNSPWVNSEKVNRGLREMASQVPHVHVISTDGLAHGRKHFGTLGTVQLGQKMAEAFFQSADLISKRSASSEPESQFGPEYPNLDSLATGKWWTKRSKGQNPPPSLDVPRDQTIAFALYTIDQDILSVSAQLFPLMPEETREVRLEILRENKWVQLSRKPVNYPGWDVQFRIQPWDASQQVRYRILHGAHASFEGTFRRNPIDQESIVVASMSCNSSRTTGMRPEILEQLLKQNPDVLFFAGDQTYRHTEHTAGWIEFGLQFRELIKDRPTVTIPDDHDVGHPNLWGEAGKRSMQANGADGGYFYPVPYVQMVERQQTGHLPPAVDAKPLDGGIGVYFTRMRWGGIDFAILEDRKFKSAPIGNIPAMGPRPDHIDDPNYDPKSIDLPGLNLLGERQHRFLENWVLDWQGAQLKCVLSQTAFCGAVHMHGKPNERLLADLDCNGWPQSQRNRALKELRRCRAIHLCGDQHLAVVVKHGIDSPGDGPFGFTSPALINTIYGRWWHPLDEKAGQNARADSPLPWTGDYRDGLGNPIRMLAYANPKNIADQKQRGDGYGIVRFSKSTQKITFECWPRFSDQEAGQIQQYPGWPLTISSSDNDGRKVSAWLPKLVIDSQEYPVVSVREDSTGELLFATRLSTREFQPGVFGPGKYTIGLGRDRPDELSISGVEAQAQIEKAGVLKIQLP